MLYAFEGHGYSVKVHGMHKNWKVKIKPSPPFSLPLYPCPSPVPSYYMVFFSRMQNQAFLNILFILHPFLSFHVLNKHGSWNPKMCKATCGYGKEKYTIAKWQEGQRGWDQITYLRLWSWYPAVSTLQMKSSWMPVARSWDRWQCSTG